MFNRSLVDLDELLGFLEISSRVQRVLFCRFSQSLPIVKEGTGMD